MEGLLQNNVYQKREILDLYFKRRRKLCQRWHWILLLFFSLIGGIGCQSPTSTSETVDNNVIGKEEWTQADSLFERAKVFRDQQKHDSAYFYYHQAQLMFSYKSDSLMVGKALVNMAIIQEKTGNQLASEKLSIKALHYLDTTNVKAYSSLAANYNSLGIVLFNKEEFKKSNEYYQAAIRYAVEPADIHMYKNNIGNNYRELGQLDSAIFYYHQALDQEQINPLKYARFISNLAFAKWLQDSTYSPTSHIFESLKIRTELQDMDGQMAALKYLTKYYQRARPDSSLMFNMDWYRLSRSNSDGESEYNALELLLENPLFHQNSRYLNRYRWLSDSLNLIDQLAENTLAIYEADMMTVQNELLRQENQVQSLRIAQQRTRLWLWIIGSLGVVSFIYVWFWRKSRLAKFKNQQLLQAQRLKTSKKVHDVVANGLYRLLSEIENNPSPNQNLFLDRLEVLYHKSRDISYESESNNVLDPFQKADQIGQLLQSFATGELRVVLVGNDATWWQDLTSTEALELEHILQEWMVNMRKHSRATNVLVRFELQDGIHKITYKDNGIGLSTSFKKGNGWLHTENRILAIKGVLIFGATSNNGLEIQLSFPDVVKD